MIVDLNLYRTIQTPIIANYIRVKGQDKISDRLSELSIMTGMHIIAVAYLLTEVIGPNEELARLITVFTKFYKITEIKGQHVCL